MLAGPKNLAFGSNHLPESTSIRKSARSEGLQTRGPIPSRGQPQMTDPALRIPGVHLASVVLLAQQTTQGCVVRWVSQVSEGPGPSPEKTEQIPKCPCIPPPLPQQGSSWCRGAAHPPLLHGHINHPPNNICIDHLDWKPRWAPLSHFLSQGFTDGISQPHLRF